MSALPETIFVAMGGHNLVARSEPEQLDGSTEYVRSDVAQNLAVRLTETNAALARELEAYRRAEAEAEAEALARGMQ